MPKRPRRGDVASLRSFLFLLFMIRLYGVGGLLWRLVTGRGAECTPRVTVGQLAPLRVIWRLYFTTTARVPPPSVQATRLNGGARCRCLLMTWMTVRASLSDDASQVSGACTRSRMVSPDH
jgi:hypothetical protein